MKKPSKRRWRRGLAWIIVLIVAFEGLRFVAVSFPYPLFPHRVRHGDYQVYSDAPLDLDLAQLFDDVERRRKLIEISPTGKPYRVFLCTSDRVYRWLTRIQNRGSVAQGYAQPHLGNVFLSLPNVERIRQRFGPAEYRYTAFAGELSQVLTHELVHNFMADALGFWRAHRLPRWKQEGYCELASNRSAVLADPGYDFAERVERAFDDDYLASSPVRRLYYRSQILTEYLTVVRGLSFAEIMDDEVSWEGSWRELEDWARQPSSAGDPVFSEASRLLFSIPEFDLYPESIATDPVSGDYFLSSMSSSRILRVRPDGASEDFTNDAGALRGSGSIGMKVDAERRRLWVCTGRYVMFGGDSEAPPKTGVVLFDVDDGTVVQSWLMDQPSPAHIFNDVALTADGAAYVTTTMFGKIYRLSPESEAMELVLETPESHNNGITLGPNERFLFFTLDRRLRRLDLTTDEVIPIAVPGRAEVGTDGLYFVDGSLVVVKPRSLQISRLFLNDSLDAALTVEVLAGGHPDFVYPTTGVVVGESLVFVATSFADVARDPASARQHGVVLIHKVGLGGG